VAQLASNLYLSVYSLPQEDHDDTDDASAREVYTVFMSTSTMGVVQPAWERQYHASVLDGYTQAYRTSALHGMRPGVLRAGGHLDGPQ